MLYGIEQILRLATQAARIAHGPQEVSPWQPGPLPMTEQKIRQLYLAALDGGGRQKRFSLPLRRRIAPADEKARLLELYVYAEGKEFAAAREAPFAENLQRIAQLVSHQDFAAKKPAQADAIVQLKLSLMSVVGELDNGNKDIPALVVDHARFDEAPLNRLRRRFGGPTKAVVGVLQQLQKL